jgi:hypothetical protein
MLFKSKRSVISWVALMSIHLISLSLISHSALAFSEREVRLYRWTLTRALRDCSSNLERLWEGHSKKEHLHAFEFTIEKLDTLLSRLEASPKDYLFFGIRINFLLACLTEKNELEKQAGKRMGLTPTETQRREAQITDLVERLERIQYSVDSMLEADTLDSILEAERARRIHPAAAQSQTSSSGSEFSSTP